MSKFSVSKKMRKLVSLYESSGQSQKAFAQSHGLTEGKLHYWIKKLSKESITEPQGVSSFIPLEVTDSELPASKTILIRMPNGLEIQIPM